MLLFYCSLLWVRGSTGTATVSKTVIFWGFESLRTCLSFKFHTERCLNWYRTRLEAGHVVSIHALRVRVPPVPLLL